MILGRTRRLVLRDGALGQLELQDCHALATQPGACGAWESGCEGGEVERVSQASKPSHFLLAWGNDPKYN